ncbi:MAG: O-antigen ligase family protein [Erysipelotrichaceae bacterium]|nr:O-antigen ligase family protein [Erysipelotrichaceae bacterium]MDD4643102.1 O-antigen ligase family protein [Erysipelotrichaceae bacterium]
MNKLVAKIKSLDRSKLIKILTITIALIILLDMDQWLYPFFDSLSIPLPSTFLTYIWLPLYVILVFFVLEPNKKKIITIGIILAVVYGTYFIIHHLIIKDLAVTLRLQNNFYYSLAYELIYMFILLLPLVFVYAIYRVNPKFSDVEKIMVMVAMLISIPIVITNILTISPSTYVGWTKANFFTWFFGIYDIYHPREIATKFFFTEGNTTGIILFATYPFTINMMRKLKANWASIFIVIIQGLAMFCIATRVASYGTILIMIAYLAILVFVFLFKKIHIDKRFMISFFVILVLFGLMFKYTPAYVNQQINSENNFLIIENESYRQNVKNTISSVNLDPLSEEYINYYSHIFVDNVFLLAIPPVYYMKLYDYRLDPKFWVDLIFEYEYYERADGRAFEKIFSEYQWAKLDAKQRSFGFGYSTFMNGGILLEKDFEMQFYTHGYIGFLILVAPWLLILAVVLIKGLINFKKVLSIDLLVAGMSFVGALGSAYMSGHTLDEVFSSIILAMLGALLLIMVNKEREITND